MKHFNVYAMVAVLLLSLQSIAQKNNKEPDHPQFKRLYIGDTVPMESIVFNNVRNYPGGKAKLSDFKGKYIILDFWTKNCSSCIAAFPHMEELQSQFREDIQILLVTKNSEDELMLLSKNSMNLKNTKLPIIIGDQILATQLFPHGTVPYHVWLDKEGKVLATTYATETNVKNLQDLIAKKKLDLLIKEEVFDKDLLREAEDQKISLLKVGKGSLQKYLKYYAQIPNQKLENTCFTPSSLPLLPYYSMFMNYVPGGHMDGYRGLTKLLNKNGNPIGLRLCNIDLENLYRMAFLDSGVNIVKIIVEGKAKNLYEGVTDTTNAQRHVMNNSYCYESCFSNYSDENAMRLLQQDLIRFLGLKGNVEEKFIKHLVLTRLGTTAEKKLWVKTRNNFYDEGRLIKSKQGFLFSNYSIAKLVNRLALANRTVDNSIITDGTTFTNDEKYYKRINLLLNCENLEISRRNLPTIQNELAKYGLGLKEETKSTPVLVLKAAF